MFIDGHCKQKDFLGAYIWYREMLENDLYPPIAICNELLSGLREEGKLEEVRIICSEMSVKGVHDWSLNEDLHAVAKV